uniref:Carboxypeptidase regulatory-like domain-containing protein n=1 Tax=Strongyloides papillosus TaxID=174720 RepID=A0A0N5BQC8_STREA
MAEGVTDENGYFSITGETLEYTAIEPYIEFKYKCPEYEENSVEDRKFLYVPDSVFRYLGYTREFKFNFDEIDLIRIRERAYWSFF